MKNIQLVKATDNEAKKMLQAGLVAVVASISAYGSSSGNTLGIFNLNGIMNAEKWRIVNDGVMGGLSQSSISTSPDGGLIFKGNVSLDNNGGFASVRSAAIEEEMGSYDGIELIFTGDGKRYICTLRTDTNFDGISHQSSFNTIEGKEQRILIPFEDFDPTWRGRRLSESNRMKPDEISSIGFMISDKQEGAFQLEIKSISAYRSDGQENPSDGTDIISVAREAGVFQTLLAAVDAAGLTDTVRTLQGVTLFAPTDEAFAKLPEGTVATLLRPENKDKLVNILTYHIIDSEVPFSTATTLTSATAVNGESLAISVKQGGLFLNDSRVVENDIKTSNGLVHIIDSVLLPPETDPVNLPPAEKLILSAISRGVPLFNGGNPQACADIYELAAEALLMLPEDHLNSQQRQILTASLEISKNQHSATDSAWTMRKALDQTMVYSTN